MSMEGIRAQIDPFGTAERWAKGSEFELQQWPIKLRKDLDFPQVYWYERPKNSPVESFPQERVGRPRV